MPEVGGKRLAGGLTDALAGIRKATGDVQTAIATAVKDLQDQVRRGERVAKSIADEAAAVRKAFDEVLGNDPDVGEQSQTSSSAGGNP